jgi:hypothetical protein
MQICRDGVLGDRGVSCGDVTFDPEVPFWGWTFDPEIPFHSVFSKHMQILDCNLSPFTQLALDHWPRGGPDLAGVGKEDWSKALMPGLALPWPALGHR